MAQMSPHSQVYAISVKDLQMLALSQALLDVLHQNWQPNQEPILLSLSNSSAGRDPSYIVLVDTGASRSLPRSPFIAGGFWAIILYHPV